MPDDQITPAVDQPGQWVTGAAGVPIDTYDAIELLAERMHDEPARILAAAARAVADLWNDPPNGDVDRQPTRDAFPFLAVALDELLAGGPCSPPLTAADVRPSRPAALVEVLVPGRRAGRAHRASGGTRGADRGTETVTAPAGEEVPPRPGASRDVGKRYGYRKPLHRLSTRVV